MQIDGVTVNCFRRQLSIFAHIPTDWLDRIEVIRGPQSALYGPYANSGVVNFVTRTAENSPTLDVLAEGGTYQTRRFAIGSAGTLAGFGVAAFVSRLDSRRPGREQRLSQREPRRPRDARIPAPVSLAARKLRLQRRRRRPARMDPTRKGLYPGLDTISRNRNNFSDYLGHYQIDLSSRVRAGALRQLLRQQRSTSRSPYGDSYNNDRRARRAKSRTVVSLSAAYTMASGALVRARAGPEHIHHRRQLPGLSR